MGYEHPRPGRAQPRMLRGMLLVRRGLGRVGSGTGRSCNIICKLLGVEVSRNIFFVCVCLCSSIETSAWITWGALYRAQGWSPGEEEEGGAAGPPRSAGPRPARPTARARSPAGTGPGWPEPGARRAAREPGRCPPAGALRQEPGKGRRAGWV